MRLPKHTAATIPLAGYWRGVAADSMKRRLAGKVAGELVVANPFCDLARAVVFDGAALVCAIGSVRNAVCHTVGDRIGVNSVRLIDNKRCNQEQNAADDSYSHCDTSPCVVGFTHSRRRPRPSAMIWADLKSTLRQKTINYDLKRG